MAVFAFVALAVGSQTDPADAVRARFRAIQDGKARPGSVLVFNARELNAYARNELPTVVPQGVRELRLELGQGTATGYAFIDFLQIERGEGVKPPWLIQKLIEGERPVKVEAKIESAAGKATVLLQRVEISGIAVSGSTLNFLIDNFLIPLFPTAKVNQPFDLNSHVDRIEVGPGLARVVMRKRAAN